MTANGEMVSHEQVHPMPLVRADGNGLWTMFGRAEPGAAKYCLVPGRRSRGGFCRLLRQQLDSHAKYRRIGEGRNAAGPRLCGVANVLAIQGGLVHRAALDSQRNDGEP